MGNDKISPTIKLKFGRVLIVDTDSMSGELLQLRLDANGFKSDIVSDGQEALRKVLTDYDIILVDLMNSDYNGLMVTRAIKDNPQTTHIPVIIYTVRNTEDDVLNAFASGADDFVAKPFSTRELVARMRAVIRRCVRTYGSRKVHEIIRFKDLILDADAGFIVVDGDLIALTNTEYILLRLFMRNRNSYFSAYEIRREAWGGDQSVTDTAIATSVSRLRSKLGQVYGHHVVCRHGLGYGFFE